MHTKAFLAAAFVVALGFAPLPAAAGSLEAFSDALENLADMTRAADHAHEALQDAIHGGRDYDRYDQDWRLRESRLEEERIHVMARIAGVSESRIRDMRRHGDSWDRIARRYDVDPHRFGYGNSRYDHDRDSWRGTPPGLARKGGMPPGQAKKMGHPEGPGKGHHPEHGNKHHGR